MIDLSGTGLTSIGRGRTAKILKGCRGVPPALTCTSAFWHHLQAVFLVQGRSELPPNAVAQVLRPGCAARPNRHRAWCCVLRAPQLVLLLLSSQLPALSSCSCFCCCPSSSFCRVLLLLLVISSSLFGRSLCPGGGENKKATSAAGPLCAKQNMRRVFSMKKMNSRSCRWPKAIGVGPPVHALGIRRELGLLWWHWGVQDEVSGLLSDPGLCGGGRALAAVAQVSLLAASPWCICTRKFWLSCGPRCAARRASRSRADLGGWDHEILLD